eukprot:Ihof_evm6s77 gene=Ihof_evmTU6s77
MSRSFREPRDDKETLPLDSSSEEDDSLHALALVSANWRHRVRKHIKSSEYRRRLAISKASDNLALVSLPDTSRTVMQ